jgi:hypothetical protein
MKRFIILTIMLTGFVVCVMAIGPVMAGKGHADRVAFCLSMKHDPSFDFDAEYGNIGQCVRIIGHADVVELCKDWQKIEPESFFIFFRNTGSCVGWITGHCKRFRKIDPEGFYALYKNIGDGINEGGPHDYF